MTNREKFKEVFGKDIKWSEAIEPQMLALKSAQINGIDCMEEWLNAEYKEPTTKNDLGVDWESYKDIDGNSLDDLILEVLQNNFDCGNTYGYKVADEIIGLLPSTPQEPILDKIFCIVHPLSIMSTPELEHKAIMQITEMLEPLCLPESED